MAIRIGVDVGGTFTDVVCFDEESKKLALLKQPSTPHEPSEAVLAGTQRTLREQHIDPKAVSFFIHGTTIATNALLERKGCRVALLVTEGFRDVLQIMRQDRPRLYDHFATRPQPLVPRHLRFEAQERMLHTGQVQRPLCTNSLATVLDKIRQAGIRDVAVCLLHSYANSQHEEQLRDCLEAGIPGVRVSLSSEILPEFKEFERMSTTVVNAYVLPKVSDYVSRLQRRLAEVGIDTPLQIMQSNGGLMTAARASRQCVQTILSGPAAGALTGLSLAQQAGLANMISIDVGGTSADVALCHEGKLRFSEENEIGGYVVKVPSIEIQTVGAGGGSIAWRDAGGALQVGPQSAGADPGPACYGRGGSDPTVTDANVALGRLSPDYFLGGEVTLDLERAQRTILEKVGKRLNLSLEQAAEGILRVINAVMAKTVRRLSVERGYDPREFTLISFGGGGPLQAVDLALDLQIPKVLIPPNPGVSSALGLLTADFRHDYVRTLLWKTATRSPEDLYAQFDSLRQQAQVQMAAEGVPPASTIFCPELEMRYAGQGFSLPVSVTFHSLVADADFDELECQFHKQHQAAFGYSDVSVPTEIVNIRLAAIGKLPCPELPRLSAQNSDSSSALKEIRKVYFQGGWYPVQVYERSELKCGQSITGPAIVEQMDSTTFFYPQQLATVDPMGNLMIEMNNV